MPGASSTEKNSLAGGTKGSSKRRASGTGKTIVKQNSKPFTYDVYLVRTLKMIHPELALGSKSKIILNHFLNDMFQRIAQKAGELVINDNRKTLEARDIETAVRLVLPGDLAKCAVVNGKKAFTNESQSLTED